MQVERNPSQVCWLMNCPRGNSWRDDIVVEFIYPKNYMDNFSSTLNVGGQEMLIYGFYIWL